MAAPTDTSAVDSRKHYVILGGGIASLITAFQLTATEELRARNRVTLYQMGWRLGGKLASGINRQAGGRSEEHGLHVWFGFYDNAFACINTCYQELLRIEPNFRYPTYLDAFQPNDYTPMGHHAPPASYGFWDITWPTLPGTPGVYVPHPTGFEVLREIIRRLGALLSDTAREKVWTLADPVQLHDDHSMPFQDALAAAPAVTPPAPLMAGKSLDYAFKMMETWISAIEHDITGIARAGLGMLIRLVKSTKTFIRNELARLGFSDPDSHPIVSGIELGFTILIGLLNPAYGWLKDFNLNRFDDRDLRAWLLDNGGDPVVVNTSSIVRALYDIPFAYENGDLTRPNFAAGAALRWALRSILTYRGHAMYVPQAGFGDVVIAPYYQVLQDRGVEFRFFHKVKGVQLSDDGKAVRSVVFDVQALTVGGAPYCPVVFDGGLFRWPTEPFWEQLQGGAAMQEAKVNFESHWCAQPAAGQLELVYNRDFDHVVLGIAVTALKRLNDEDGSICDDLITASPRFRAMTEKQGMVATAGVQFWFKRALTSLGWDKPPATVGGPEPLDVWADMSQVLTAEHWNGVVSPPLSLQYLCGPMATELASQPASNKSTPDQAAALTRQLTLEWLKKFGKCDWPGANDAGAGGFDWNVLYDAANGQGEARLDAQFLRANIDPTECCGTSFTGTTRFRIGADELVFDNLSIVGADTNTGINVTCVEGATISAMKASRKLCGSPQFISGENFLGGPFPP